MNQPLYLKPVNDGVCAVLDAQGQPVGNLKRIGAVWKFKAVGTTAQGELVPGGGPLTERHNMVFERPDAAEVSAGLLTGFDGVSPADGMADMDAAAERRPLQQRS